MLLYYVLLYGWGYGGEYVAKFILIPLQSIGLVFKIQTLQRDTI